MLSRKGAQALLTEYAKRSGLQDTPVFDEEGYCIVGQGQKDQFHFLFDEDKSSFSLIGVVGPVPDDARAALQIMRYLLRENLTLYKDFGATLALMPSADVIVLEHVWEPCEDDDDWVLEEVNDLILTVEEFKEGMTHCREHYTEFVKGIARDRMPLLVRRKKSRRQPIYRR